VVDPPGNHGKTFLARYLNVLYGFQYLDGTISTRDLGSLVLTDSKGFVFDVSRAAANSFDYSSVESLKNGILVSGKYRGSCKTFVSTRILVFSNDYPHQGMLSMDRWQIVRLGEGEYRDMAATPIVSPSVCYPFVVPPPLPDLSCNFDTRSYLVNRLRDEFDGEIQGENSFSCIIYCVI